jgi:sortase A
MVILVRWKPLSTLLLRLSAGLLILGGSFLLLVSIWALAEGALYQHFQDAQFRPAWQLPSTRPADPTFPSLQFLPTLSRVLPSDLWAKDPLVIGKLEVPGIQLSVFVREGMDEATLRKAVGHVPSTALPGKPGNFVVLGHRDTFFRPLRNVSRGDKILIRTERANFTYLVQSVQVVGPDWPELLEQTPDPTTTLITCFPFQYTGPAPRRFVVQATLSQESSSNAAPANERSLMK